MLPSFISVGEYNFNTFGAFVLLGFMILTFVIWSEGKKDGFDEERMFDMLLLTSFGAVLLSRLNFAVGNRFPSNQILIHAYQFWTPGVEIYGAVIGALSVLLILSRFWKWSVFRILDIYSLGISLGASVVALGFVALQKKFEFLFVFSALVILYALMSKLRNSKIASGLSFSTFLIVSAIAGVVFWRGDKLPLYASLVTISLATVYVRRERMTMMTKLPEEILNRLKSILKKRDAELEKNQEALKKEEPYMAPGRANDNAEFEDDAMEDINQAEYQLRMTAMKKMGIQIKKALAKMKLGTYGICEVCKKPIDKARLEVYPAATTCIEHADSK
ncbi:prolipoprotein diacylglyceryl transferase [candidate division WWE3 bacterium]|nr:prolipoprotein diacylglyceryl transferase [candidate division WWE3 bacterium]